MVSPVIAFAILNGVLSESIQNSIQETEERREKRGERVAGVQEFRSCRMDEW
jgi:hypothetical protein